MKKFNNLQELWSYCLFCPICKDMTRKIDVLSGPTEVIEISSFSKEGPTLSLSQTIKLRKRRYRAHYHIDCPRNTFTISVSDPETTDTDNEKSSSPCFSFYLNGVCSSCKFTFVESSVMALDLLNKTITNIGVVFEEFNLANKRNRFRVTQEYSDKRTFILKCDEFGEAIKEDKPFEVPLIEFDLSNIAKAINKIKTLLVFS